MPAALFTRLSSPSATSKHYFAAITECPFSLATVQSSPRYDLSGLTLLLSPHSVVQLVQRSYRVCLCCLTAYSPSATNQAMKRCLFMPCARRPSQADDVPQTLFNATVSAVYQLEPCAGRSLSSYGQET